jgi:uncharacterized protein (TIGR03067 family)
MELILRMLFVPAVVLVVLGVSSVIYKLVTGKPLFVFDDGKTKIWKTQPDDDIVVDVTLESIQGLWEMVSVGRNGNFAPPELIEQSQVAIAIVGNTSTMTKTLELSTVKINNDFTPNHLDQTDENGDKHLCIVRMRNGLLEICQAEVDKPRPSDFDHMRSDGASLTLFKRTEGSEPKSAAPKSSLYHRQLEIPVEELSDEQKRKQLLGSISWANEGRIDELFSENTDFIWVPPSEYDTWLGTAISKNCDLSILNKLIAAGCDPNTASQSPEQSRPLGEAINTERIEVIEWILEKGADPNLGRPLVSAVTVGSTILQVKILEILLNAGADINNTYAYFGDETQRFTVLDWASDDETKAFLKDNGAKQYKEL